VNKAKAKADQGDAERIAFVVALFTTHYSLLTIH
jgi:hypothetical protein